MAGSPPINPANVNFTGGKIAGVQAVSGLAYGELFNFKSSNTRKLRSGLARVRTGGATLKIGLLGDSTTRGMGSNGALFTNSQAKSFPKVLADQITTRLMQATNQSFWASGNVTGGASNMLSVASADPRISNTGAWDAYPAFSLGGNIFQAPGAGTLTFTPTVACDTYDTYWSSYAGAGSVTLDIGGLGATTTSTGGGTSVKKITITQGTANTSALNIAYASGATSFLIGVAGRNSASDKIEVWNMGASGSKIADWVALAGNNAYDPRAALPQSGIDISFINLCINDWVAGTNAATYLANLQLLAQAAQQSGDVILTVAVPSATTDASAAAQAAIVAQVYALARTLDLPVLDLTMRWADYTTANGLSYMYDTKHPAAKGYSDVAAAHVDALLYAS